MISLFLKGQICFDFAKNNLFRVAFEPIALFCTNMQDFMLIPNLLKLAQKCSGKKLSGKNYANLCCKDFDFFPFLPATFSEHFLNPFGLIWNQLKILRFYDSPH
jgi:hypothetical protein